MTKQSPDDGIERAKDTLIAVHAQIAELRRKVAETRKGLETGEDLDETELKNRAARLDRSVDLLLRLENKIDDGIRTYGGQRDVLDITAAREEVRCRLDRLADCGGAQRVSE
ncbi:MAG: hypothetical protein AAGM84_04005 [Pseudomonadota bacterium]